MDFNQKLNIILEDKNGPSKILYVINAILSTNSEEDISIGLQKLMQSNDLAVFMSAASPDTSFLHNWLDSKPSNIRKLLPIFDKFDSDVADQLIDLAMQRPDENYEEGGDYYHQGQDDGGGGC